MMNEFTKEELEEIAGVISSHINSHKDNDTRILLIPIIKKLEEIIDNYCEHKNAGQDYSCNRCWDCHYCW